MLQFLQHATDNYRPLTRQQLTTPRPAGVPQFPRLSLVALDAEDYRLVSISESAAALTCSCTETICVDGAQTSGRLNVAALWRRSAADWRLLLWQITPVAEET
jgi:hypothetical protein